MRQKMPACLPLRRLARRARKHLIVTLKPYPGLELRTDRPRFPSIIISQGRPARRAGSVDSVSQLNASRSKARS